MDSGQVFSGEFLLGFMLFMAALVIMLNLWDVSTSDVLTLENRRAMAEYSVEAAEKLVRTPGIPADWGVWNVTSLGLANESRVLMEHKLLSFKELMSDENTTLCSLPGSTNYDCNAYVMGIGGYDFYFNLTYLNDSTVTYNNVSYYTGRPPVNESERITVVRAALFNNELARIYFTVWE